MNTARVDIEADRLGPAAPAPTRIDPRVPVVAVLLCVVFACFFLIGRATRTASGVRSEVPSTLPVASVSATIPVRLSDVQPIYVATPAPPAPNPAPPRSAPAPEHLAPVLKRAPAPVPASAAAPSAPAPSAPAPAPEPTRSFSPAPSEATHPAAAAPSSGRSSGGGGGATPSKGNGGSFDSSG